ncbi:hypothetical protein V5738_03350 [Salinisphaera sp. SPP-AMP-43]|uniref:hypothetical protein n=1 Tax=Salinisphaera sp. SPP-AMP-43 TaxID=3121288 RepID=UPI003C6E3127
MFAFIKAFIAGFIAMLTFHQGLLWLLDRAQVISAMAWSMTPAPLLGIPEVLALALWGGLWGLVIWFLIRHAEAAGYYVGAIILSAILLSAVALTVVPLVLGGSVQALIAGMTLHRVGIEMALNGSYGLGLAVLMRIMHPPR